MTEFIPYDAAMLAAYAHRDQVDKMGRNYFVYHLTPVALELATEGPDAMSAGYLHDIIEDTSLTAKYLLVYGVPEHIVEAVVAVTRQPGETYWALIERAAAHPLGRLVKLADNAVNLRNNDLLAQRNPMEAARLKQRYEDAREYLLRAGEDHR